MIEEKNGNLPREIERKFLINMPDRVKLQLIPRCNVTQIEQTYLCEDGDGMCRRVRRRGNPQSGWQYTLTKKQHVAFGERIELEEEISHEQYEAFLKEADPGRKTICKTRYCFPFRKQVLELDVYAFSETLATLEIELSDIETPVILPSFIEVIADVTDDERYSNAALSRALAFPDR